MDKGDKTAVALTEVVQLACMGLTVNHQLDSRTVGGVVFRG